MIILNYNCFIKKISKVIQMDKEIKKRLLNSKEAMIYLGISSRNIFSKMISNSILKPVKLYEKSDNKYDINDLDDLIQEKKSVNK
jgi:predicted DNA-binding transcriptional regulator AlpA